MVKEDDLMLMVEHLVAGRGPPLISADRELNALVRTLFSVPALGCCKCGDHAQTEVRQLLHLGGSRLLESS